MTFTLPNFHFDYHLDHIGIAVNSLEEGAQFYRFLGMKDMLIEEVASEKVRVGFIDFNGDKTTRIELLEATDDSSPIAQFIKKRGVGIHHICLRVKSLVEILKQLKDDNIRLIHETPKIGAHNCMIAFIHPSSCGGVLVELSEKMES
ncbi:MAG: methylmalonyl-CoA epimerase [Bdellovibrionaceae bacterium]|jgi:methylmalonyl-CoA epimerase|nr:methylmalonyl-CoA epimerase [Pseudobdellovibrionaceae bacterium]